MESLNCRRLPSYSLNSNCMALSSGNFRLQIKQKTDSSNGFDDKHWKGNWHAAAEVQKCCGSLHRSCLATPNPSNSFLAINCPALLSSDFDFEYRRLIERSWVHATTEPLGGNITTSVLTFCNLRFQSECEKSRIETVTSTPWRSNRFPCRETAVSCLPRHLSSRPDSASNTMDGTCKGLWLFRRRRTGLAFSRLIR